MLSTNKGAHIALFPMALMAQEMKANGYEYPQARRIIAEKMSYAVGREIKVSPKFHECFNFIGDLLKGRIVLEGFKLPSGGNLFNPSMLEEDTFFDLMTLLEPAQIATYSSFLPLVGRFEGVIGSSVANTLSVLLTTAYPDKYPYRTAFDPAVQKGLCVVVGHLVTLWGSR
ncbi:MAG: hypothetical protein RR280_04445 [Bacteroidaceae bacterium]